MTHPVSIVLPLVPMSLSALIPNGYVASWLWMIGVLSLGVLLASVYEG